MIVREVRPSDFERVFECYLSFYDELEHDPALAVAILSSGPTVSHELEWFAGAYRRFVDRDSVFLVAEADSRIVGYCMVTKVSPGSVMAHRGELSIALRSEHRGRGVGTALLGQALHRCRGRFESVELAVLSNNLAARRLYERFGFKPFGVRARAVKRGERYFDEDLMALAL
ncbi:MAG: GNAT family N-acetyltransferase [Nitrososphaerales archaeon]|jgi:ribosomal protein S18 acetylase RimI-like enzyme